MIGLAVFVLVVVALASMAVLFSGGYPVRIDMHWFAIKTSVGVVFLAGAVALGLVVFALSLLWEGIRRGHRRRKETRELRRRAQATSAAAQAGPSSSTVSNGPSATTAGSSVPPPPRGSAGVAGPDDHFDSAPRER